MDSLDKEFSRFSIDAIYENWTKHTSIKITIQSSTGERERLWAVVIGSGYADGSQVVGIDNVPLMPDYRWQDIVQLHKNNDRPNLIYRKWNALIYFHFESAPTQEEDLQRRNTIFEALKGIGHPGFLWEGLGYILMEQEQEEAEAIFEKTSASIPFLVEQPSQAPSNAPN